MPAAFELLVVLAAAAFVALLPGVADSSKCPAGCHCQSHHEVLCVDAVRLPAELPSHTATLHLDSFNFSVLPTRGLANLPGSLRKLWLSQGSVGVVEKNSFAGLASLRELVLEQNTIHTMHQDSLGGLFNLTSLTIRHSNFETISSDLFASLRAVTSLAFESNYLTSVPINLFQYMAALRWLSLDGNRLKSLPNDMSWNGLSVSLTELSLEDNQLSSLGNEVFNLMKSLRVLSLAYNQLRRISKNTFSGLNSLEVLNLSHNPLGVVPRQAFSRLPQLLEVRLQHTDMSQGQGWGADTFLGAEGLLSLDLSDNPYLGQVPTGALARLSSLETLLLDNTGLANLTAYAFANITSLRRISLYRSQVRWLDESCLAGLTRLQSLNLKENLLSGLPKLVFTALPVANTTVVELGGNLWTCDCYLRDFAVWMHLTHPQGREVFSGLECTSPVEFAGARLWDISPGNLTCPPVPPMTHQGDTHARLVAGSVVGLLFAGIVLGVGGYLYYDWRKKARHVRYRQRMTTQQRLWDDTEDMAPPSPPEITVYCNPRDQDYTPGYQHISGLGEAASPFSSDDNESGEEGGGSGVNSISTVTQALLHDTANLATTNV